VSFAGEVGEERCCCDPEITFGSMRGSPGMIPFGRPMSPSWRNALAQIGVAACVVHEGRSEPGPQGALVCFSGRGPGEVFQAGRKLMGMSQWRSREGSLFRSCAYTHWDPAPLVELFDLDLPTRESLVKNLARSAVGVDDLDLTGSPMTALGETLVSSFPTWSEDRSHSRA